MNNIHGLDANYFSKKMKIIIRDISNYTKQEFGQELLNMQNALDLNDVSKNCTNCKFCRKTPLGLKCDNEDCGIYITFDYVKCDKWDSKL